MQYSNLEKNQIKQITKQSNNKANINKVNKQLGLQHSVDRLAQELTLFVDLLKRGDHLGVHAAHHGQSQRLHDPDQSAETLDHPAGALDVRLEALHKPKHRLEQSGQTAVDRRRDLGRKLRLRRLDTIHRQQALLVGVFDRIHQRGEDAAQRGEDAALRSGTRRHVVAGALWHTAFGRLITQHHICELIEPRQQTCRIAANRPVIQSERVIEPIVGIRRVEDLVDPQYMWGFLVLSSLGLVRFLRASRNDSETGFRQLVRARRIGAVIDVVAEHVDERHRRLLTATSIEVAQNILGLRLRRRVQAEVDHNRAAAQGCVDSDGLAALVVDDDAVRTVREVEPLLHELHEPVHISARDDELVVIVRVMHNRLERFQVCHAEFVSGRIAQELRVGKPEIVKGVGVLGCSLQDSVAT